MRLYLFVISIIHLTAMAQNSTTVTNTESSYNTESTYSRSVNKAEYFKVQHFLFSKLGNSGSKKSMYTYWEGQNTKDGFYEIRLYTNKIKIEFKSNQEKSSTEKFITDLIIQMTDVLDQ